MAEELVDGKKSKKKGGIKDYKNLTGRQKAAIFLVAIGSDVASDVMKHLREDEVETLTFEIARLDTIDADFKDQVLEEFQELMQAQNFITTGGIDFARELLEKSLGSQKAIDIINRLTSSLQVRPFDFIRRTDPAHLLNFVQQEYPQTISLILINLIFSFFCAANWVGIDTHIAADHRFNNHFKVSCKKYSYNFKVYLL